MRVSQTTPSQSDHDPKKAIPLWIDEFSEFAGPRLQAELASIPRLRNEVGELRRKHKEVEEDMRVENANFKTRLSTMECELTVSPPARRHEHRARCCPSRRQTARHSNGWYAKRVGVFPIHEQ